MLKKKYVELQQTDSLDQFLYQTLLQLQTNPIFLFNNVHPKKRAVRPECCVRWVEGKKTGWTLKDNIIGKAETKNTPPNLSDLKRISLKY